MKRFFAFALSMAGLFTLLLRPAQSDTSSLQPGQVLPQFSGETLTGKSMALPAAARGEPALVVFSFSKAAGNDSRSWSQRLSRDFAAAVPIYTIIELESVPKLFRGMALSGIKGSIPAPIQERTIVLYRDEALWKQRLAFSDGNRAYVILLDPDGRMRWSNQGLFTETSYAQLKDQVKKR
jgi:ATP10 protein